MTSLKRIRRILVLSACSCFLILLTCLSAQESIQKAQVDENRGAVVVRGSPGMTIALGLVDDNKETSTLQVQLVASSDQGGLAEFSLVPPGLYVLWHALPEEVTALKYGDGDRLPVQLNEDRECGEGIRVTIMEDAHIHIGKDPNAPQGQFTMLKGAQLVISLSAGACTLSAIFKHSQTGFRIKIQKGAFAAVQVEPGKVAEAYLHY